MASRRLLAVVILLGLVAACAPAPSGGGSSTAPSQVTGSPISHATGSAALLFRISVGGGFAGLASRPRLALFGDGTLVFLAAREPFPSAVASVQPLQPYRVGHLTEDDVQAILSAAVAALGPARASYRARGADYFTTTFTLRAGGFDKEVSAFGLEAGDAPSSDAPTWTALRVLLGEVSTRASAIQDPAIYAPAAYLAVLLPHEPVGAGAPWPWPSLRIEDFPLAPNHLARERRLSAADVAALGIPNVEGGVERLVLAGPDGKPYDLRLVPLLPDESS